MEKLYYIYIVRSKTNTLYTGITTDIGRRMDEHMNDKKKGAKYTRAFKIDRLELVLTTNGRSNASKIECFIKSFTRQEKEMFIKDPQIIVEMILDKKSIKANVVKI